MEILLQKEFVFHPEDDRTNRIISFETERDYDHLEFVCEYSPKTISDPDLVAREVQKGMDKNGWTGRKLFPADMDECKVLMNFVTFSLDHEGEYVGCAHRHDPEQIIVISEQGSSRGFFAHKAAKGNWRIVLNVQAAIPEHELTYHLTVIGCDKPAYTYRPFEMHCHTLHSDGRFTVHDLAHAVKDYGYVGFALTDHNTEAGQAELTPELEAETVPAIRGIEWTTFFGHMLVLGCEHYVDWRFALPEDIDTYTAQIREAGGIAGIAHPFNIGAPMCAGCRWDFKVKNWDDITYIEVWSQEDPMVRTKNIMAIEWWTKLLNEGHHLACTAGRDWHCKDSEDVITTATYLGLPEGKVTQENALDALRDGRTYVTLGPTMDIEVRQDGKEYNLGDTLKTGACEVRVDVRLTERRDMWEKWGIEVHEIALTSPAGTKKYPYRGDLFCVQAEGDRWLRVELYGDKDGQHGQLLAMSSPVYFD